MASITIRNGRFLTRVRREGYKPVAKSFTRRQDALAWARQVEAAMESGRWSDPESVIPTFADAITMYKGTAAAKLKGAAKYTYWLDELHGTSFARTPVNLVASKEVAAWRDEMLRSGLKPGTVVRKLGMLSGFFSWCQKDQGWIRENPARGIRRLCVHDARDRTLSSAEYDHLIEAARTGRATWLADAITVLAYSGMRRGELWALTVGDIDFDRSIAQIRQAKNGHAREVPLCPTAAAALKRLCSNTPTKSVQAPLIPVADPSAVSLAFRRTVARARRQYARDCQRQGLATAPGFLSNLRLHDLRHTAVTRWARTGALSMLELAAVSGHKGLVSLKRYAHLTSDQVAAKLACIANAS